MYQRIKTPDSKATKTFRSKRCKTIGPESCLRQQYKYHTILDTRNVTEMNGFAGMSQFSNMQLFSTQNGSAFKSPRLLDRYDEDNQNLTTDFTADWSRMDAVKRQTYSRLRNKLVKKFPSFRQKYKAEDITEETQPSIRQSKRSQSENKNRIQGSVYSTNKVNDPNAFKNGYFYSRSQKKCLYNSFTAPSQTRPQEQQKQTPIPRLSFLNYIKNNKERQALKFKKVKGQNMIKTRDKILTLQKQGTQSFLGLKKCLEESIEACILSK